VAPLTNAGRASRWVGSATTPAGWTTRRSPGRWTPRPWARISPGSPLPRHRCSRTAGSTRVGDTGRTGWPGMIDQAADRPQPQLLFQPRTPKQTRSDARTRRRQRLHDRPPIGHRRAPSNEANSPPRPTWWPWLADRPETSSSAPVSTAGRPP